MKLWFYNLMNLAMRVALFLFSTYRLIGRENIPRRGPVIVVANHLNMADPPLIGMVMRRPVRFMAKIELFGSSFATWIMTSYGAFAVRRGEMDREALRRALAVLKEGQACGILPEGHRTETGGLQRAKVGVAYLAVKSRAPILPIGITGTEAMTSWGALWRREPITVRVGRPFSLDIPDGRITMAQYERYTDQIMRQIAALLPESYRGVYRDPAPAPEPQPVR